MVSRRVYAVLTLLVAAAAFSSIRVEAAPASCDAAGLYGSTAQAQTCLDAIWTIADQVLDSSAKIANCLRMCFHDAGAHDASTGDGGANGSILFELASATNAGLSPFGNPDTPSETCAVTLFGAGAPNSLDPNSVLGRVRAVPGCASTSFADVLQVSCAMGLFVLRVPGPLPMKMGRIDAGGQDARINVFPSGCSIDLVGFWQVTGISDPVKASIVLQGAHNIGRTRSPINTGCAAAGVGAPFNTGPQSLQQDFDGLYHQRLVNGAGPFDADASMVRNIPDRSNAANLVGSPNQAAQLALAQTYASNPGLFLSDFNTFFKQLSELGCGGGPDFTPTVVPAVRSGGVRVPVPVSSPPPPPVVVDSPPPPPVVVDSPPPPPPVILDSPPPPPVFVASPPPPPPPPVVFDSPPPPPVFVASPPPPPVFVASSPPPPFVAAQASPPPPPPPPFVAAQASPPPPATIAASSPPPPASISRPVNSPPPPSAWIKCGNKWSKNYCRAKTHNCCGLKVCCPKSRKCCGTQCCQPKWKCRTKKVWVWYKKKFTTTYTCSRK